MPANRGLANQRRSPPTSFSMSISLSLAGAPARRLRERERRAELAPWRRTGGHWAVLSPARARGLRRSGACLLNARFRHARTPPRKVTGRASAAIPGTNRRFLYEAPEHTLATKGEKEGIAMTSPLIRIVVGLVTCSAWRSRHSRARRRRGPSRSRRRACSAGKPRWERASSSAAAVEKLKGKPREAGLQGRARAYDDQAKPDAGVSNAKNIVADKEILGVIGHLTRCRDPSSEVYKDLSLAP